MPNKHSFDPECLELARHFLDGEPKHLAEQADDLAQAIQDAVESWFEYEREEPEPGAERTGGT